LAASLSSVHDEVDAGTPVAALTDRNLAGYEADAPIDGGLPLLEPSEALELGDLLAFVRLGDRWRPGTLEYRCWQLGGHPRAAFSVAAHALVDAEGSEVLVVPAPLPPIDPIEILLHPSIEPATVLVRAQSLDEIALSLLTRPGGDAVLWSRLACADGFVSSGEIAADVLLNPSRHGLLPRARTAELTLAANSLTPLDAAGAATVRRELLRRLYLEPEAGIESTDLTLLLGEKRHEIDDAAAVIADLQWALERQHDMRAIERIHWPDYLDKVIGDEEIANRPDAELADLQAQLWVCGSEIVLRDAKIRRLEAEVYRRDAVIAELTEPWDRTGGAAP
jgi:hypothetical protein